MLTLSCWTLLGHFSLKLVLIVEKLTDWSHKDSSSGNLECLKAAVLHHRMSDFDLLQHHRFYPTERSQMSPYFWPEWWTGRFTPYPPLTCHPVIITLLKGYDSSSFCHRRLITARQDSITAYVMTLMTEGLVPQAVLRNSNVHSTDLMMLPLALLSDTNPLHILRQVDTCRNQEEGASCYPATLWETSESSILSVFSQTTKCWNIFALWLMHLCGHLTVTEQ